MCSAPACVATVCGQTGVCVPAAKVRMRGRDLRCGLSVTGRDGACVYVTRTADADGETGRLAGSAAEGLSVVFVALAICSGQAAAHGGGVRLALRMR